MHIVSKDLCQLIVNTAYILLDSMTLNKKDGSQHAGHSEHIHDQDATRDVLFIFLLTI